MADYLDRMTDHLVRQIGEGRASFQTSQPGGTSFMPENMNGTPYRAGNALTLAAEGAQKGFEDTRWVTRQRGEKMGGQVRAGETGTPIQYWQIQNGSRPTMMTAVVYNAEQFNGLPARERTITPMEDRQKAVAAVVAGSNATIQRTPDNHGWDRSTDIIRVQNRPLSDNIARQQQEVVKYLTDQTAHPSRMGRDLDPTQEKLRTTIATMLASDRLKIGFEGDRDPQFARAVTALVTDRGEIARAAMVGERIAQEVTKYGQVRNPELSANQMQELARQTLSPADRQAQLRRDAWAATTGHQSHDHTRQQGQLAQRRTASM